MRTNSFRRPVQGPGALTALGLAALMASLALLPRTASAANGPTERDSNPRIRPKEVTVTPSVKPAEARAGETVTYQVTAKLKPGWHIYKYDTKPDSGGPRNTTFDFFETAGLKLKGGWTPSRPPIRKPEPAFDNMVLEFYEDEVSWSITLEVPAGTAPGEKTLRCQAGYQICDASSCKIPGRWTLPDVVLKVVAGGAAASTSAPAPVAAAVQPAGSDSPSAGSSTTASAPSSPAPSSSSSATTEPSSASASASASGGEAPVSEVAQRAERGLFSFMLFSAAGGLLALVMPCVWPMIPITVNFFVKQGARNKGKTTGLAIAYCLAIIGVFTSFGVLISFFFSATALQNLANNPWLNAVVALLFVAFGLSLLGLFEIRLPNFLLNASARGESKGGMVGVMFMALTLTITSFTCTFPVVGGLIVMAAGGQFFYPIVGLATFSAVLAFPFFLLALAPSLIAKMPKSGDWMNTVKVVGGLIELGAALKFINTAEIGFGAVPEDAWFDAPLVLSVWVGLALVSGLYLLGLFRTDHDHDEVKVGPGRLLVGSSFLALALFLAPAIFGHPPRSPLWDLLVGILPADVDDLAAPASGAAPAEAGTRASSTDPAQAQREETRVHGVVWGMSYDAALEKAKTENRPILIDFTGVNCANCRAMEQGVMPRKEVVGLLSQFITVQLYTDFAPIASLSPEQRKEIAEKNQELLLDLSGDPSNPVYVVLSPEGKPVKSIGGKVSVSAFVDFLKQGLERGQASKTKVAQAVTQPR
jgi:thiol:disulfide interchange protein DsbD